MPFTLSHAAAVLPFLHEGRGRGPLIASALVAGSLAPDVPFFVESLLPGAFGFGRAAHRPWALPTVDVAIAAGLVASWHGLLREPLVALLPDPWADRAEALTAPLRKPDQRDAYDAAWFTASATLGALTHVGWDSFTHHGRAGVRAFPALRREVAGMPVHQALQWGTSAAGLGVLAVAGHRALGRQALGRQPTTEPRRIALRPAVRRRATAFLAASAVLGAAHRAAREVPRLNGRPTLADLVAIASFGAGTGAAVGATAYALAMRVTASRPPGT